MGKGLIEFDGFRRWCRFAVPGNEKSIEIPLVSIVKMKIQSKRGVGFGIRTMSLSGMIPGLVAAVMDHSYAVHTAIFR